MNMYHSRWDWFYGNDDGDSDCDCDVYVYRCPREDYHSLAKDKKKCMDAIIKDPNRLFYVVDNGSTCMCGGECGNCETVDMFLIELILRYKTLTEADFVAIDSRCGGGGLDWRRIAKYAPLSNDLLEAKKDVVDWKEIISDDRYVKNREFILRFREYLEGLWDYVGSIHIGDVEELVFGLRIIPVKVAIYKRLLNVTHIDRHYDEMVLYIADLLKNVGVKKLSAGESWGKMAEDGGVLQMHPNEVRDSCIRDRYVAKEIFGILAVSDKCLGGDWGDILGIYVESGGVKPEEFCWVLEKYVLKGEKADVDNKIWFMISKRGKMLTDEFLLKYVGKIDWNILERMSGIAIEKWDWGGNCELLKKLPAAVRCKYMELGAEFIDANAEDPSVIDWHVVCEYQRLPEWLMRKHSGRLDWGQVSWYQDMSLEFIEEFRGRLNEVKLEKNRYLKK